jgi:hypothetical protein
VHAERAIALVLYTNAVGDHVEVGLRLLEGNTGLQPFSSPRRRIGTQWQRQNHIDFIHRAFRRHHLVVQQKLRTEHARHGV